MQCNFQLMNEIDYKITVKGSLGILALGDVGLIKWRKVRDEKLKDNRKNEKK